MNETDELRAELAKRGVEYETADISTYKFTRWCNNGIDAGWGDFENGEQPHLLVIGLTPVQAIDATVGRRDTMELWPEWEQVLFANVSDEVTQDNLNECVHELLEKAATVGEESEMHICKRCGVAYELNIIDKGFGKPRFCPNCGHRRLYQ